MGSTASRVLFSFIDMLPYWSGAGDIKLIDCDDDEEDDDNYLLDEAGDRRYKVVFHLYGVTLADIDEVIKEIDELGNEAVSDRVIDDVENQAHIAKLTADQVINMRSGHFPLGICPRHFPICYHYLSVKNLAINSKLGLGLGSGSWLRGLVSFALVVIIRRKCPA